MRCLPTATTVPSTAVIVIAASARPLFWSTTSI